MRIAQQFSRFRMKQRTHKPKFSFATNFSWWFGSLDKIASRLQPGFLALREARLKPAQEVMIWTTQPPTEVGGKQDNCGAITMASHEILSSALVHGPKGSP